MSELKLLDCTLRDGGYVNQWKFGETTINEIVHKLTKANIDIIELGYLKEISDYDPSFTLFPDLEIINKRFCMKNPEQTFACMINFGDYALEKIEYQNCPENLILRIAFHKEDYINALNYSEKMIKKGMRIFMQPMGTVNYSDAELLELIHKVNEINPEAFYIVDSFGTLEIRDFRRLLAIAEHNLKDSIQLGYHSHNNKQQAYSNAQYMLDVIEKHISLIDVTIFGIGRGAGNLSEELFAEYVNNIFKKNYKIYYMLEIMDLHLNRIYMENPWGYQLSYYLSAKYNCHPNYATFFSKKNSLTVSDIDEIFGNMTQKQRLHFSEEVANEIYENYQKNTIDDSETRKILSQSLSNREILLLGPGKSINLYKNEIQEYIEHNNPVIIALNYVPTDFEYTYVMCTNLKRWDNVQNTDNEKLIVTSNIHTHGDAKLILNYETLECETTEIADNVAIMLLHLLIQLNIKQVKCAGIDGYSGSMEDNYANPEMSLGANIRTKMQKNKLLTCEIKRLKENINISFITPSIYEK